jgi:hypothetical protein
MLDEANARLKRKVTPEELDKMNAAYVVMDLDKDDFCKIVDAIGVEKLIEKQEWYERLLKAEEELKEREIYEQALKQKKRLQQSLEVVQRIINEYEGK